MRTFAFAALTMVTALGATQAQAQRLGNTPGAPYPMPSAQMGHGAANQGYPNQGYPSQGYPSQPRPAQGYPNQARPNQGYQGQRPMRPMQQRWTRDGSGRWNGGSNAPGGWNAYHRPTRGYRLPNYWIADSFFIGDYAGFGLSTPPAGYGWRRYYDDAVLTDSRGRVYDWANNVNWDGEGGYGSADGYGYGQGGGQGGGYGQSAGYAEGGPGYPPQVIQNNGVTTYTTSSGYAGGGYYAAPSTTTVVTIQSAPTVTTTTTEYVEETRTRYVAPRRVYRARYHAPVCGCRIVRPVKRVWHRPVEQPVMGS